MKIRLLFFALLFFSLHLYCQDVQLFGPRAGVDILPIAEIPI